MSAAGTNDDRNAAAGKQAASTPLIGVRGLVAGYHSRVSWWSGAAPSQALRLPIPDFTLHSGKLLAVLGPNGSGKSTLLRTLAGLQFPLEGSIHLAETALERLKAQERAKRLAYLPSAAGALGGMRVRELATLGRHPHTGLLGRLNPEEHELVDQSLDLLGISQLSDRPVAELSDGERQKALLARVLVQQAPLLLLDEPSAHLDVGNKVELFRIIRKLSKSGNGLILATHELELALRVADFVLLCGERPLLGSVGELLASGELQRRYEGPGLRFDPESMLLIPEL